MTKGQAWAEYMIILAVVIIIAGIAMYLAGLFASNSGQISERDSASYWASADVGITRYYINSSMSQLVIKNDKNFKINVTSITSNSSSILIAPGGASSVVLDPGATVQVNVTGVICYPGTYFLPITINYTDFSYNTKYSFTGEMPLVGSCMTTSGAPPKTYYQSTNDCSYQTTTSSTCTSGLTTYNCAPGTYFPMTPCNATPPYTNCIPATLGAACNTCGDCSGGICGAAACGTTYGCGGVNICSGAGAGSAYCIVAGSVTNGNSCLCNQVCASGICNIGLCAAPTVYYENTTSLCGYQTTTNSTCGSGLATANCSAGYYFPTQSCSSSGYTSCQPETSTASCAICGNCSGGICAAAACGSQIYCSGMCNGTTGGCITPGSLGTGAACLCNAVCYSGNCSGGICAASTYYQSVASLCGYQTTTNSTCGSGLTTTNCLSGYFYPSQTCNATPANTNCIQENSTAACNTCGNCTGGSCVAATCGSTFGCTTGVCNGGIGAGSCSPLLAFGSNCNCSGQCTSGNCSNGKCSGYAQGNTSLCNYYFGDSPTCTSNPSANCASGTYFPTTGCSATNSTPACVQENSTAACNTCGNCTGGSCVAATCGSTFGCTTGACTGGITGAGSCNSLFAFGHACNCSGQCGSGVCSGGVCAAYYANMTSLCGYYFGNSSTCTSNPSTNCNAGYYFPTVSCGTTTSTPSCTAETTSAAAACATCGNCSGGSCNPVGCGTTVASGNAYGCSTSGYVCNGSTGAGSCNALFANGHQCSCNTVCSSGICSGGVCAPVTYYKATTNYCGFQSTTVSGCGSGLTTTYCGPGNYYTGSTSCSSSNPTSCSAETYANSCGVCGDCQTGSDTCSNVSCGASYSYGCSNVCDGQGVGAGDCHAAWANGHSCYCDPECSSGHCISGTCQTPSSCVPACSGTTPYCCNCGKSGWYPGCGYYCTTSAAACTKLWCCGVWCC